MKYCVGTALGKKKEINMLGNTLGTAQGDAAWIISVTEKVI